MDQNIRELEEKAQRINILGKFCGMRDLPELTPAEMENRYGFSCADVMVLFGGSILCGGDVLAQAMRSAAAKKYIIAGGAGHTTPALRAQMHLLFPDWETETLPEAELFSGYLMRRYGLKADLLETHSTNCGNNITFLLDLLKEEKIDFQSIILCQDATMQRRMDAVLRKYAPQSVIINFAAYEAEAAVKKGQLGFAREIPGMWTMEEYLSLLMGEIPRLRDDAAGYGPRGKNFQAHVDIPESVQAAFSALKTSDHALIREADQRYASPS